MVGERCRSDVPPPQPSIFLKTKKCMFFASGKCTKGASCPFAHAVSELRIRPNLDRTKMCPRMQNGGKCDDAKCGFAHALQERRRIPREKKATTVHVASYRHKQDFFDDNPDAIFDEFTVPLVTVSEKPGSILEMDFKLTLASEREKGDDTVEGHVPWTRLASAVPCRENMETVLPSEWMPCRMQFQ
eukprot:TRINITY_DN3147_c0_g1_i1.p1 TRINITY_DN3147_c0_g1~~TRINITY_DN3147_c0_g1_i1.p1  ORF type:complete len:187 (-),score=25.44 TRINITY_DN3147_c0_g1_i1:260-820(-)